MAKMSHEKIAAEVATLGYELIDDSQIFNQINVMSDFELITHYSKLKKGDLVLLIF